MYDGKNLYKAFSYTTLLQFAFSDSLAQYHSPMYASYDSNVIVLQGIPCNWVDCKKKN